MEPENLQMFLEIVLGRRVARAVCRECGDDPHRAVDSLNRRAVALQAPFRKERMFDDTGFARTGKEITRLHLLARLIDELDDELGDELGVELARS